jgi:hypothetical protein
VHHGLAEQGARRVLEIVERRRLRVTLVIETSSTAPASPARTAWYTAA